MSAWRPLDHRRDRAAFHRRYHRTVVEVYRARADGRAPRVLINGLDGDDVDDRLTSADSEGLDAVLLEGIRQLFDGGADIALLASASVHAVYELLKDESPVPVIGIVDAIAVRGSGTRLARVGLCRGAGRRRQGRLGHGVGHGRGSVGGRWWRGLGPFCRRAAPLPW